MRMDGILDEGGIIRFEDDLSAMDSMKLYDLNHLESEVTIMLKLKTQK